jgi:hypothetical protein
LPEGCSDGCAGAIKVQEFAIVGGTGCNGNSIKIPNSKSEHSVPKYSGTFMAKIIVLQIAVRQNLEFGISEFGIFLLFTHKYTKNLSKSFANIKITPTFALPNYKGSLIYVSTHSNQIAILRPQSG